MIKTVQFKNIEPLLFRQPEIKTSVSLRDFAKQNRGNPIKNRKIFDQRLRCGGQECPLYNLKKKQRLTALINCFAIDWIATIFSTKKSRNDTRFLFL